jgi:hypothetical protein
MKTEFLLHSNDFLRMWSEVGSELKLLNDLWNVCVHPDNKILLLLVFVCSGIVHDCCEWMLFDSL